MAKPISQPKAARFIRAKKLTAVADRFSIQDLMANRKPKRPSRPKSKPKNQQPKLAPARAANPEVSEPESSGLVGKLRSMFGNSESSPNPNVESSLASLTTSNLSAEVEAKLAAVPDVIGGEADLPAGVTIEGEGDGADESEVSNLARVDELVQQGPLDTEFVGELLGDGFESLAEYFESDHWKLKEKQIARISRPATACLNAIVDRLFAALPDAVGEAAGGHPEFAMLAVALGGAVIPRSLKQWKVSRARAANAGDNRANESGSSNGAVHSPIATGLPATATASQKPKTETKSRAGVIPNVPAFSGTLR